MVDASHRITWLLPSGERRETLGYRPINLLGHAEMFEIGIPQACGGQAECGTCRLSVEEGEVTPAVHDELLLMGRHAKRFAAGERLGCRARPRSDLVVRVLAELPPDLRDFEGDALVTVLAAAAKP